MTLCARLGDKVISLHSVRTAKQVLDIVERTGVHRTCTPILHWFTGSKSEIRRAIDLGCYFSVNEQMLKTLRGRSLLETVPLARLLTETDAPFQSGADGPKAPGDIEGAVSMIAESLRSGCDREGNASDRLATIEGPPHIWAKVEMTMKVDWRRSFLTGHARPSHRATSQIPPPSLVCRRSRSCPNALVAEGRVSAQDIAPARDCTAGSQRRT